MIALKGALEGSLKEPLSKPVRPLWVHGPYGPTGMKDPPRCLSLVGRGAFAEAAQQRIS